MTLRLCRSGSALIACTIVLVVISVMAVAMAGFSTASLTVAKNQRQADQAFASAESGLEVMRYWLSRARVPSTTPPAEYVSTIITAVQNDLQTNNISNFAVGTDGSIPTVLLDAEGRCSFRGQWSADAADPAILNVTAVGTNGPAVSTVTVRFNIAPYHFPIFNYGMATKGALQFPRNPTLTGVTQDWEADIYVESANNSVAVQVGGNAKFDGNIDIGNSLATVDFQGDVQIAGDVGQAAIDNHVTIGADSVEFPVPLADQFRPYATGPVLDSTYDFSGSGMTLTNAVIQANTNPTFTGQGSVTIQGILYIESPNIVTFAKNVSLEGLIVGPDDPANSATNAISFQGNFSSAGYPAGAEFDALRQLQGSSILTPGFAVSFTGNFSSVNGVLAARDLYFSGNSSAVIKGTMITYSQNPAVVEGNISMNFDRAAMVEIPAGFDLYRVPEYNPTSYAVLPQ